MQKGAIAIIVVLVALGAVWFFFFRGKPAPEPVPVAQTPATSTLGGSIYTKVQAQNSAQTSGSIANPANPFDTGSHSGSAYQNPFAQ